jgi:hypothetical protein
MGRCHGSTARAAAGIGFAFTASLCIFVSQPGRARAGSFGPGSVHVPPFGPVHFGASAGAGLGCGVCFVIPRQAPKIFSNCQTVSG